MITRARSTSRLLPVGVGLIRINVESWLGAGVTITRRQQFFEHVTSRTARSCRESACGNASFWGDPNLEADLTEVAGAVAKGSLAITPGLVAIYDVTATFG